MLSCRTRESAGLPAGQCAPHFLFETSKRKCAAPGGKEKMFGGSVCASADLLPPVGEGWQSLAAVRDGNARPLRKSLARGNLGYPLRRFSLPLAVPCGSWCNGLMRASAPTTARGARSEAERAERGTGQMRPCNPIFVGARAAGICRQIYTAPRRARRKAIANPQAPSRADPRTATLHVRAKLRPKRFFSLDRARPVSLLARPKEKWGVHLPSHQHGRHSRVQWDAPQHPPAGYPHTRHSLCKRRLS